MVRTRIGAPIVALMGLLVTILPPTRWTLGPRGRPWERLRVWASQQGGQWFDDRTGPRPIEPAEFVGTIDGSLEHVERRLWAAGFVRNPLSRAKTRKGRLECGSWVRRKSPLAIRQLHVMCFRCTEGGVAIYAHEEYSSVNPLVAHRHVRGETQDPRTGVRHARAALGLEAP